MTGLVLRGTIFTTLECGSSGTAGVLFSVSDAQRDMWGDTLHSGLVDSWPEPQRTGAMVSPCLTPGEETQRGPKWPWHPAPCSRAGLVPSRSV